MHYLLHFGNTIETVTFNQIAIPTATIKENSVIVFNSQLFIIKSIEIIGSSNTPITIHVIPL